MRDVVAILENTICHYPQPQEESMKHRLDCKRLDKEPDFCLSGGFSVTEARRGGLPMCLPEGGGENSPLSRGKTWAVNVPERSPGQEDALLPGCSSGDTGHVEKLLSPCCLESLNEVPKDVGQGQPWEHLPTQRGWGEAHSSFGKCLLGSTPDGTTDLSY